MSKDRARPKGFPSIGGWSPGESVQDVLPKKSSHLKRWGTIASVTLAIAGVTVIAFAAASQQAPPRPQGLIFPKAASQITEVQATITPFAMPSSEPTSISVPAIGVNSPLLHLGLAEDGSMEVPRLGLHYNEAAWYRHSPTPGALGPAVITGHVDSAKYGPSVFFKLGELQPGDQILIARADGLTAEFRVDTVQVVPKDEFPTEAVFGNTTVPALRLITCGGPFDQVSRHYLENVIVYASLVTPAQ